MKTLQSFRKQRFNRLCLALALLPSLSMVTVPISIQANPNGATVISGGVTFSGMGTGNLNINQSTNAAIINWADFSIEAGEITRFNQPGVNSVALNRVTGSNPSSIMGTLSATGSVFLVNPNGVMVGSGGVIDVGGSITLSTLDITNQDFLDGGANRFFGSSANGVTNFGSIRARNGDAMFLGGFAHNFSSIEATRGAVVMASGSDIIVDHSGEALITVRGASDYDGVGVSQQGNITGSSVDLQSHGNAYAMAINNGGITRAVGGYRKNGRSVLYVRGSSRNITNTGTIQARNGSTGVGGEIRIDGGEVANSGTLDVSGDGARDAGTVDVIAETLTLSDESVILANSIGGAGSVNLEASDAAMVGGLVDVSSSAFRGGEFFATGENVSVDAVVNARGASGGTIKVGGDFQGTDANGLLASKTTEIGENALFDVSATVGNAGQAIVWSDGDTLFQGEARANAEGILGNGGLIEVSGKENLTFRGIVSARSEGGKAGVVLFDPGELLVGNGLTGTNEISNQTINGLLQGGTSVLLATEGSGSHITFQDDGLQNDRHDAIQWTNSNASFGAFAGGDIIVQTHIRTSGAGSINLIAGWGGTESEAAGLFINGAGADEFITPDGRSNPIGSPGLSPSELFEYYVTNNQFGENDGIVFVGASGLPRHVEVGSRYGDTNVAGSSVLVTASDTNGITRHTQIGFRDSGTVFAPRNGQLDLNNQTLEQDNDPLVGIVGRYERADGEGVYAINSQGVHDGGILTGPEAADSAGTSDATFIPYANHYMSAVDGNWWWQLIDRNEGSDPQGLGGNRPEHGAGRRLNNGDIDYADINVLAKNSVFVQGGGRDESGAYIGHGGNSSRASVDRAWRTPSVENGQAIRYWTFNGASNDRTAVAIGRLAPVYGNINVLAGISTVDSFDHDGNVTATIAPNVGTVLVEGLQRMGSANNPDNEDQANGPQAAAQIGHGGTGQFGDFNGDIQVRAGGSVIVRAGSQTRAHATIGHTIDGYAYWDPPSNADAQIRFFANASDFNDPLLRRGELWSGTTNVVNASLTGDTYTGGTGGVFPREDRSSGNLDFATLLSDPTTGAVVVEALDGSVVNGFHGDVTVEAVSGDVLVEGYTTPDRSETGTGSSGDQGLSTNRDRRFAKIGHGGSSFAFSVEHAGWTPNRTDRWRERVTYRMPNNGSETGTQNVIGETGQALNRALTFMTITGDIDVTAGRNVSVIAGNDTFDFAQIGHGGNQLADYETSSFVAGDISLNAGGSLTLIGGGQERWTGTGSNNTASRHMRSQAHVGHGGYQSGFLAYYGDIDVNVEGDVTVTGGAYGDNYAKIGHKGAEDFGQVGGTFSRTENFDFDGVSIDIETTVNADGTTLVQYSGETSELVVFVDSSADPIVLYDTKVIPTTADITVNAGGDVVMNHLEAQTRQNLNQLNDADGTPRENSEGQMRDAFAQIGHGGHNWGGEYYRSPQVNYDDMVGDITVTGANLTMTPGNREGFWTRIGHGFTGEAVNNRFGEEMLISGAITVDMTGDILMDGSAALERDLNNDQPAHDNGIAIGHGAFTENDNFTRGDLGVLDGATINGLTRTSTITVGAGGNITLIGGNGASNVTGEVGNSGTHTQIGHGMGSQFGTSSSARGFQGDVNVSAEGNISLTATSNGIANADPAETVSPFVYPSAGGAAIIGNGGINMDAPATGNINVYAGGDLSITSPNRRVEDLDLVGTGADSVGSSLFNFAKIGHFSTEGPAVNNPVNATLMEGDISVIVGGNMEMNGGKTPAHSSANFVIEAGSIPSADGSRQGVTSAFSQVGHGGPGIQANIIGDIEVLVQGDLFTTDGSIDNSGQSTPIFANNYVKIGHGDWMREGAVSGGTSTGALSGDIVVAVGGSADLEHTMIGHIDPRVSSALAGVGSTTVAVSRTFPFFGGAGTITATGVTEQADAVGATLAGTGLVSSSYFTSGSGGGDPLSFFIPNRDNNFVAVGTRLNNAFYGGNHGGGFPTDNGFFADEVFLAPDLWWMNDEQIAGSDALGYVDDTQSNVGRFPADNASAQGGTVAEVDSPGGLLNVSQLVLGALGSSTNVTSADRTAAPLLFFYDSIEAVPFDFPAPPGDVPEQPVYEREILDDVTGLLSKFDSWDDLQPDLVDGFANGPGLITFLPRQGTLELNGEEFFVPNWLEEAFDMIFGPRTSGRSFVNNTGPEGDDDSTFTGRTDIIAEDMEQADAQSFFGGRPVGPNSVIGYQFVPGANYYSSFRIFGNQ